MELKLLSWNVNGIRAVVRKEVFFEFLAKEKPDILCLQETKAHPDQLNKDLLEPESYTTFWSAHETKKGYSGVGIITREKPISVRYGFGLKEFDNEGRIIIAKYPAFTLFNIYFPKGERMDTREEEVRLKYKLRFYDAFLNVVDTLKSAGERLIVCGDFNTAHNEIDLSRPKENRDTSGFLPEERAWMDKFVAHGLVDTFRTFNPGQGQYTWWDMKTRARERNIGWRLDYFFITQDLLPSLSHAFILSDVTGSDHCPVGINLKLE
jgi:exodeoxyribonuclease III